jgi:hypothetical protein
VLYIHNGGLFTLGNGGAKVRTKHGITAAFLAVLTTGAIGSVAADVQIGDLSPERTRIAGTVTDVFGNKFVLADETGKVLVEAGPWFHHRLDISRGEQLAVLGEMKQDGFDAFSIVRADGQVVEIQAPLGPPTWAGPPPWVRARVGQPDRDEARGAPPAWAGPPWMR